MTILNTIELTRASWIPFVVAGILIISVFIVLSQIDKIKSDIVGGVLVIYVLLALVIGFFLLFEGDHFRVPTGEYQYEVIFEDDVSFTEIIEKYNIVEQRGEIFVVEEKE